MIHIETAEIQTARNARIERVGGAIVCMLAALLLSGAPAHAQTHSGTRSSSFSYYGASDGSRNGLLKSETIEPIPLHTTPILR